MTELKAANHFKVFPVTPKRWDDLEALFGDRGACGGCWCMYWRLSRKEFDGGKGPGNKAALKSLVNACQLPGLIAYDDGVPAGWCSLGPRQAFPTLNRSRILKPVDDKPVWSVVCFFVDKKYRWQGLTVHLLQEAVRFAAGQGAAVVEGYPVIPRKENAPPVFIYTGTHAAFQKAGFIEVARPADDRPIMRYYIDEKSQAPE